jgi:NADH:ubiquinone oxidoreductase subunit E
MKTKTPFVDHLFVCNGERCRSLSPQDSEGQSEYKNELKSRVAQMGLKGKVRVSQSGCLGCCDSAPNVMCYPRGDLYSQVVAGDLAKILSDIPVA